MKTTKMLVVGTNALLQAAKNLLDRGELSVEQYQEMQRRNMILPKDVRHDKLFWEVQK